jgi:orotidine-5'-phosphate decarboxylase
MRQSTIWDGWRESSTAQAFLREGQLEAATDILLSQGEVKFGPPDDATRAAIEAMTDVGQLRELCVRLVAADSWEELVPLPGRRRARRPAPLTHFADRLTAACRAKGNALCVGLDPRWDALPHDLRTRHDDGTLAGVARAFEEFSLRVIDRVSGLVPAVKPQSAFFEMCGPDGMLALQRVLRRARERGLLTILDGKRNDIASTAVAYADAAFDGVTIDGATLPVWDADALTVNPYLGRDAVEPFLESARRSGRGLFLLVRTSNPGARQFQYLDCGGKPLYRHVAKAVRAWARKNLGQCGLGDAGAVVGATYPAELAALRRAMPEVPFLVPGYGAQGGEAADVAGAFRPDGTGALVNSSRGITCSFRPDAADWEGAVVAATRAAVADLAAHTPMAALSSRPPGGNGRG